jgi:5'-3' exonuclease
LCFFLGNDFLPHFPALNIRTTGINHLINAYKFVFNGNDKETLTQGREINWKNMRKFIAHLALNELDYIKEEYVQRDKLSKRLHYGTGKPDEDENLLLPLKERAHELYINPHETGWETRYYKILFNISINDDRRKDICTNYLEGLEWTMKYYSTGCADWRWLYHYHYPPLLVDLIKYVPYFDHTFVPLQPKQPVSPLAQLSYVLPPSSMELIPYDLHKKLLQEQPDWYVGNYVFLWAFCKFFWEAHVELPHIDMDVLEGLVK